jgi:hypothetical protein
MYVNGQIIPNNRKQYIEKLNFSVFNDNYHKEQSAIVSLS